MSKIMQYRQDVYRAIDEVGDRKYDPLTVEDIVDFVRWDVCRESRFHYVRDAVRDMVFDGILSTTKDGQQMLIFRTDQFSKPRIRNPWIHRGA